MDTDMRIHQMNVVRVGVALLGALAGVASIAWAEDCPKQAKTEQALIEIERRWAAAYDARDAATMGCLLAPEYMHTGSDGAVRDRKQSLAHLGRHSPNQHRLEEVQVQLLGDVAVVRGTNRSTAPNGRQVALVRFTDVFAYRGGQWVAITEHESRAFDPEAETAELKNMLPIEVTAEDVQKKRKAGEDFMLLDVREPSEVQTARVEGATIIPMGEIPARLNELPDKPIVVMCHHGVRSLKVTTWLRQHGFDNVQSMRGGIDAWSKTVDPKVPTY